MSKSKMPHLISCSRKELSVSTIFHLIVQMALCTSSSTLSISPSFWIPNSIAPAGILVGAIS